MRTQLCFVLPGVEAAQKVEKELLLARIQDRCMHLMAKRGTDLGELPEASVAQTTDSGHGIWTGLVLGGALGALFGFMISRFPQIESTLGLGAVLLFAWLGSSFGVWIASMLASSVPNSELKGHDETLDADKVVPMRASRNWVVWGLAVLGLWAIAGRAVGQTTVGVWAEANGGSVMGQL